MNVFRSALFFGTFGRLPARYADMLVGGTSSMVLYNVVNLIYSPLSWARKANLVATNAVLLVLFASQLVGDPDFLPLRS